MIIRYNDIFVQSNQANIGIFIDISILFINNPLINNIKCWLNTLLSPIICAFTQHHATTYEACMNDSIASANEKSFLSIVEMVYVENVPGEQAVCLLIIDVVNIRIKGLASQASSPEELITLSSFDNGSFALHDDNNIILKIS